MRSNATRHGTALLDAVVALTVLGLSGVALITLLGQTAHSMNNVRRAEQVVLLASDELNRLVLYDRSQLTSRIGGSLSRGWFLRVVQSAPGLFDVSIAESETTAVVLRTTVYRPDSTHAEQ